MKIRYVGPAGARILGAYSWLESNGYVQEVDAAMAAELLTYPRGGFVVDHDEPLRQLVGPELVAALALAGVGSVEELAALEDMGRVARETGARLDRVRAWVKQARRLTGYEPEVEEGTESPDQDA